MMDVEVDDEAQVKAERAVVGGSYSLHGSRLISVVRVFGDLAQATTTVPQDSSPQTKV
jgi:hypothetical protein